MYFKEKNMIQNNLIEAHRRNKGSLLLFDHKINSYYVL